MRNLIDFHARYLRREEPGGVREWYCKNPPRICRQEFIFYRVMRSRVLDPYITLVARSLRASQCDFPDNSISPVINNDRHAVVARVSLLAEANKLDRMS